MGCTAAENFFAPGLSPVDHLPWAENPALKQAVQPQCNRGTSWTDSPTRMRKGGRGSTAHARQRAWQYPPATAGGALWHVGRTTVSPLFTLGEVDWLVGWWFVAIDYIDSWVAGLNSYECKQMISHRDVSLVKGHPSFVMAKSCKPYRVVKLTARG